MNYFSDTLNRPRDFAENPFPLNTKYEDISTELLDALINHVTILKAYALGANHWSSVGFELPNPSPNPNPKISSNTGACGEAYLAEITNYEQLFNWLIRRNEQDHHGFSHPTLHLFQQDVLILGQSPSNPDIYWFFWYAMSGRCDIGRFQTEDSLDKVLANFHLYVESVTFPEYDQAKEIPLDFFKKGWISF